jgi:fluoroquinolone transport system permease protein
MADVLIKELHFDLSEYYPFIASFFIMLPPMLYGFAFGFIILDERDERLLTYFMVTPLSRTGYLMYRIASSTVMGFLFCFLIIGFSGLVRITFLKMVPVALMVSLEAPLMAFFLAAFADNKVEGIALGKGIGVLYAAPFIGYFIRSDWQLLAGIVPPYWVSKAFLAAKEGSGSFAFYVLVGIFVHLVYFVFLVRRFQNRST